MCSICKAVASAFMTTITVVRPPTGFVRSTDCKLATDPRLNHNEKKSPGTLRQVPGLECKLREVELGATSIHSPRPGDLS